MDKREFLKKSSLLAGGLLTFDVFARMIENVADVDSVTLAADDDFWQSIRGEYKLKEEYINLENGYYCIMPQPVLNAYLEHVKTMNMEGSYYMRKKFSSDQENYRDVLASMAGCTREELVITRNTTEALDLIIGGFPWEAGDEAIMIQQDYGAMLDMFTLQEKRHGIVTKRLMMPNDPQSDEEIVNLYEDAITEKTKLIMICHMINITGHILPVRKICDMAHSKGVEVMVDGAHSFAHIPGTVKDLDCDYYGTSLHKWLSAPLGCGFLYIKKEKQDKLWPLFAENANAKGIKRLNHTGTKPPHVDMGIINAVKYFNLMGAKRKEDRLRFINQYWTSKVRDLPNVIMNTPADSQRSCAIANVGIKGMSAKDMAKKLLDDYKIWTVGISRPGVEGCRITPNVYTSTEELDVLVKAITELSGN